MAKQREKGSASQVQRHSLNFDGTPCVVCGAKTRRMLRPAWWVCERGHRLVRKSR